MIASERRIFKGRATLPFVICQKAQSTPILRRWHATRGAAGTSPGVNQFTKNESSRTIGTLSEA
jgi:hypothetical protein